ncbi:MAG: GAF domain-containing protein [Candidatus Kapaibacterium sp.]
MHEASYIARFDPSNEEASRTAILGSAIALLGEEHDATANCANIASLLYHSLPHLSWCGWYLIQGAELVLGPFHGKPACTRIGMGKGVCGTAAAERRTIIVDDVSSFDGHIACDAETRSELVVPLLLEDRLIGVFDLDSPIPARFSTADASFIESVCRLIAGASRFA